MAANREHCRRPQDTPDKSKQHSGDILLEIENSGDASAVSCSDGKKNSKNVAGGLKASLYDPRVSDDAKRSAMERLGQV